MPKWCWCVDAAVRLSRPDSPLEAAHWNRTEPEVDRQSRVSISATSQLQSVMTWVAEKTDTQPPTPAFTTLYLHIHTHMQKWGMCGDVQNCCFHAAGTMVSCSKSQLLQRKVTVHALISACVSHTLIHSQLRAWGQTDTRCSRRSSQWHQGCGSKSGGSAHSERWPSPQTQRVRWLKLPPWLLQSDWLRKETTSEEMKQERQLKQSKTWWLTQWRFNISSCSQWI